MHLWTLLAEVHTSVILNDAERIDPDVPDAKVPRNFDGVHEIPVFGNFFPRDRGIPGFLDIFLAESPEEFLTPAVAQRHVGGMDGISLSIDNPKGFWRPLGAWMAKVQ